MSLQSLIDERVKLIQDARAIQDAADKDKRELKPEEDERVVAMLDDAQKLLQRVEREQRILDAEQSLEVPAVRRVTGEVMHKRSEDGGEIEPAPGMNPPKRPTSTPEYRDAFWRYFRNGRQALYPHEVRDLNIGTDVEGGFVSPDEFIRRLMEALRERNVMRSLCSVIATSSGTGQIPVVAAPGIAYWTAEGNPYTKDDTVFGQETLGAFKATALMLVSEELLNDAFFDLSSYVAREFANRVGDLEEEAYLVGPGTTQPTGILDGIATGKEADSATAITADEIIDTFHALPVPYRPRATWLMHDSTAAAIRKFKSVDNQYLWQPGLQAGQPDLILGRPVSISRFMPEIATTNDVIAFGDFSYAWIGDRQGPVFQRLNELYAENGQVGFRGFSRSDIVLTMAEAITKLTMG